MNVTIRKRAQDLRERVASLHDDNTDYTANRAYDLLDAIENGHKSPWVFRTVECHIAAMEKIKRINA